MKHGIFYSMTGYPNDSEHQNTLGLSRFLRRESYIFDQTNIAILSYCTAIVNPLQSIVETAWAPTHTANYGYIINRSVQRADS